MFNLKYTALFSVGAIHRLCTTIVTTTGGLQNTSKRMALGATRRQHLFHIIVFKMDTSSVGVSAGSVIVIKT